MSEEIIVKPVKGQAEEAVKPAAPPQPVRKAGWETVKEPSGKTASNDDPGEWFDKMSEIARDVERRLKSMDTEMRIEVDRKRDEIIVRIIDPEDGSVLRQIPSAEIVAIRDRLDELAGILYDSKT